MPNCVYFADPDLILSVMWTLTRNIIHTHMYELLVYEQNKLDRHIMLKREPEGSLRLL